MTIFKVALLQMLAHSNDQEANMKKGIDYCREAAALGEDRLVDTIMAADDGPDTVSCHCHIFSKEPGSRNSGLTGELAGASNDHI
jgi:hypothetical protein